MLNLRLSSSFDHQNCHFLPPDGFPKGPNAAPSPRVIPRLSPRSPPLSSRSNTSPSMTTATLATLFVICVALTTILKRAFRLRLPLPPGPRKLPIIGNFLTAPTEYQWIKYAEWAKEYNTDILHIEVLGSSLLVLSSIESANELLNRRSALTCSRPVGTMLYKLMGWDWNLALTPYGEKWRARRRVFWQEFNPSQSFHHYPAQLKHARRFIQKILDLPHEFLHHAHYTPASIVLEVTYGIEIETKNDPNIVRAEKATVHFDNAIIPGGFLVDVLPFLQYIPRWVPGAGFRRYADVAYADTMDMVNAPYAEARKLLTAGQDVASLVSHAFTRDEKLLENKAYEQVIKDTAAMSYAAGADTTRTPLISLFAAMAMFPEVQRAAQKEIDDEIGSRLSTFDDMSSCPYTQALVWELMRWTPALPLGFFHLTMSDDIYCGYHLPKGSAVVCNVWAIMRDENIFPEPDQFMPERFLKDGKPNKYLTHVVEMSFGFGRRICPGRYFAWDSVWILAVSTLAVFNISMAKDDLGCDIVPDLKMEPLLITKLCPFRCSITPRSTEAMRLIREIDPI